MKIAIITQIFPKVSETFILNDIVGLIQLGHDVDIFAFGRPQIDDHFHEEVYQYRLLDKTTYFDISQDKFRKLSRFLKVLFKYVPQYPQVICKCWTLSKFSISQFINNLCKLEPFLEVRYDIIHCHFGYNALEMVFLKDLLDIKLVCTFHGSDISKSLKQSGQDKYRELFKKADFILTVSEYFRERLAALGCPENKIKIHYCGVDTGKFYFVRRDFNFDQNIRILSVGRLVEKKGMEYAIESIAYLLKDPNFKNLTYTIIGDGKQKDILEDLVRDKGLTQNIQFLRSQNQNDVIRKLLESDIFLLPCVTAQDGDQEGMPVAIKEAMAVGVPVMSTYHAGIPEIIEDKINGLLAPERDVDALTKNMQYLIEHPHICQRLTMNARKKIEEHFDVKKLNIRLVELYKDLISNGKNINQEYA